MSNKATQINELIPAMPKQIDINLGFASVNKLLKKIHDVCHNYKANRALFDKLMAANSKGVTFSDLKVQLTSDITVPVYLYLLTVDNRGRRNPLGSFGATKRLFQDAKPMIRLGLYGDEDEGVVNWFPSEYQQTLDHEVTHAYQKLEVAMRSIKLKNKKSSYNLSQKELSNEMKKVSSRAGSGELIKQANSAKSPEDSLEKRIEYYKRPGELGANANALLRQLVKYYGLEAIETIGNYLSFGKPSLEEIDKSILSDKNFRSTVWYSLTALSQHEQKVFNIRNVEDTSGYALKKDVLKLVYEYYKRYYKNRRT